MSYKLKPHFSYRELGFFGPQKVGNVMIAEWIFHKSETGAYSK